MGFQTAHSLDARGYGRAWTGCSSEESAHVHEYDYIVVPVTGGVFTVVDDHDGTRGCATQAMTAGWMVPPREPA